MNARVGVYHSVRISIVSKSLSGLYKRHLFITLSSFPSRQWLSHPHITEFLGSNLGPGYWLTCTRHFFDFQNPIETVLK